MEKITSINQINRETPEGQLLLAALAKISTESQTDKTPEEIIEQCNVLKDEMFKEV